MNPGIQDLSDIVISCQAVLPPLCNLLDDQLNKCNLSADSGPQRNEIEKYKKFIEEANQYFVSFNYHLTNIYNRLNSISNNTDNNIRTSSDDQQVDSEIISKYEEKLLQSDRLLANYQRDVKSALDTLYQEMERLHNENGGMLRQLQHEIEVRGHLERVVSQAESDRKELVRKNQELNNRLLTIEQHEKELINELGNQKQHSPKMDNSSKQDDIILNYTKQISNLQTQILNDKFKLNNQIDELSDRNRILERNASSLQKAIDDLNTELQNKQQEIFNLKKDLFSKQKKIQELSLINPINIDGSFLPPIIQSKPDPHPVQAPKQGHNQTLKKDKFKATKPLPIRNNPILKKN